MKPKCNNSQCLVLFDLQIATEDHGADWMEQAQADAYFVDFLRDAQDTTGDEPDDAEPETPKVYEPIPSFQALSERLGLYLQQYNEAVRGNAMDLVFFKVRKRALM